MSLKKLPLPFRLSNSGLYEPVGLGPQAQGTAISEYVFLGRNHDHDPSTLADFRSRGCALAKGYTLEHAEVVLVTDQPCNGDAYRIGLLLVGGLND
jgi:hypothetical protein